MGSVIGGQQLSALKGERLSIALYGPSGSGKSTNGASFAGGARGKLLYLNIESGPEEGAGGATPLLHLAGIHECLTPDQVRLITVRSWADMCDQVRWIKANLQKLIGEGYTTLFVDGGTELSRMLEVAFTTPNAESIMGSDDNGKRNRLLTLVPDITGFAGRNLEMSDYGMMYLRFKAALDVTKSLPFVLIWSFLEGQAYDEKDTNIKTGAGPDAVGRKLPGHIPSWFDACFHCERSPSGDFVWLTSNDPKLASSSSPYRAKHRFGKKLKDVEPADGDRLLNKLGIYAPKNTTSEVKTTPNTVDTKVIG